MKRHIWPVLDSHTDWNAPTLESLWLLSMINEKHGKWFGKNHCQAILNRPSFISEALCTDFLSILDSSSTPIHIMKQHPALNSILNCIVSNGLFDQFWQAMEKNISKSSSYKTGIAFHLLGLALDVTEDKKQICRWLTRNVVQAALHLMSRLESSKEEDDVTYELLSKFVEAAKEEKDIQIPILKSLLIQNIAFDMKTGRNTVQQLITVASPEALKFVGNLYRDAVLGKTSSMSKNEWTSGERVYACQQLAKLANHPAMQEDSDWKVESLCFILAVTLFQLDKPTGPVKVLPLPFSRESRSEIKHCFFKALDVKTKNVKRICEDLRQVANFADSLLEEASPMVKFSPKSTETWKNMLGDVTKLQKKKDSSPAIQLFQLMYLHMGFQLFSDPDMACETLDELKQCHARALKPGKKGSKSNEEPMWIEVITDLLLSLQSQNKHVLRQLANNVFAIACDDLTDEALDAILAVIRGSEKSSEDKNDGDAESEDDDWEDMEEEDEATEDEDEEEEEEEEEDKEESNNDENIENLREKLDSVLNGQEADSDEVGLSKFRYLDIISIC